MALSGRKSRASSYHLGVQAADLCRTEHNDGIYDRTVPAFRKEHRITDHIVLSVFKVLKELLPVRAVSVYLAGSQTFTHENVPELLSNRYERKENSVYEYSENGRKQRSL